MTNGRNEPEAVDRMIAGDLESLKRRTLRDLPTLEQTVRMLGQRPAHSTREGSLMRTFQFLRMRPWLTTACGVAVLAAILLAVPISYTMTTGYDVRLSLASNTADPALIGAIAKEFKAALRSESVSVNAGGAEAVIQTKLGPSSRPLVEATARAFAANLTERGIPATASVRPVTERISTSLYAYASGRILEIRVNSAGKTDEQIAEEIRQQLDSSGLQNPSVTYKRDGDQVEIQITGEREEGAEGSDEGIETRITIDGKDPVEQGAKQVQFKVDKESFPTDAAMEAEVERQLREQGVTADVTVQDRKIVSIDRH